MSESLSVVADLGPSQGLTQYLNEINSAPILSAEEEKALARRYHTDDDLDAARQLVFSHLRYVVSIARGFTGYGLPLADLIQEGSVGLMKAVKRFDHERDVRLVSFAVHWIKAEIYDYVVRNWKMVKVATTKAQRKLFFNLRKNRARLGVMKEAEVQTMAAALDVKPETVREMEVRMNGSDLAFDPEAEDDDTPAPSHLPKPSEIHHSIPGDWLRRQTRRVIGKPNWVKRCPVWMIGAGRLSRLAG